MQVQGQGQEHGAQPSSAADPEPGVTAAVAAERPVFKAALPVHVVSVLNQRKDMEDRHSVFNPALRDAPADWSGVSYFAVLDGHNGSSCVEYVNANLIPTCMAEDAGVLESPEQVLQRLFMGLDESFLGAFRDDSGTVGVLAAVVRHPATGIPREVIFANTGDCRAIVVRKSGTVKQITRDHQPRDADECERVIADGGRICEDAVTVTVDNIFGMTRSFGHPGAKPHLTARPEVFRRKLRKDDVYICLASDGLWNTVSSQEVGRHILKYGPQVGIEKLVALAQRADYDNITLLVVRINFAEHLPF